MNFYKTLYTNSSTTKKDSATKIKKNNKSLVTKTSQNIVKRKNSNPSITLSESQLVIEQYHDDGSVTFNRIIGGLQEKNPYKNNLPPHIRKKLEESLKFCTKLKHPNQGGLNFLDWSENFKNKAQLYKLDSKNNVFFPK